MTNNISTFEQLSGFANELAIANANFVFTWTSKEIDTYSPEALRLAIISRVKNICELSDGKLDVFIDIMLNISDEKMIKYREALSKYADVIRQKLKY